LELQGIWSMQAERTMLAKMFNSELQSQQLVERVEVEKGVKCDAGNDNEEQRQNRLNKAWARVLERIQIWQGLKRPRVFGILLRWHTHRSSVKVKL
jgi:hypothetical protein